MRQCEDCKTTCKNCTENADPRIWFGVRRIFWAHGVCPIPDPNMEYGPYRAALFGGFLYLRPRGHGMVTTHVVPADTLKSMEIIDHWLDDGA